MPTNDAGSLFNSKMVDFALVLRPARDTTLSRRIMTLTNPLLDSTGLGINQSSYPPLQHAPIAVAVETKTDRASAADASIQLSIWTAAWHERMRTLGVKRIIELPLLQAVGADWKLWIAFDEGDSIVRPLLFFYLIYLFFLLNSLRIISIFPCANLMAESCRTVVFRQYDFSGRDISLVSMFETFGRLDRRGVQVMG
jgi:hypothetical protein